MLREGSSFLGSGTNDATASHTILLSPLNVPKHRLQPHQLYQNVWGWEAGSGHFPESPNDSECSKIWEPLDYVNEFILAGVDDKYLTDRLIN